MRFKVGDKVRCFQFLYPFYDKHRGKTGTFVKYSMPNGRISYVNFGQSSRGVPCWTEDIKPLVQKNEQLLFDFMER